MRECPSSGDVCIDEVAEYADGLALVCTNAGGKQITSTIGRTTLNAEQGPWQAFCATYHLDPHAPQTLVGVVVDQRDLHSLTYGTFRRVDDADATTPPSRVTRLRESATRSNVLWSLVCVTYVSLLVAAYGLSSTVARDLFAAMTIGFTLYLHLTI
jgi:hypothetical protein